MSNSLSPIPLPAEENLDLKDLQKRLQEAYPTASSKLIATAIEACQIELRGDVDPGRLIRCVCERMTA